MVDMSWPMALALGWLAGELGHRFLVLPRISSYGIVGFALGATQAGLLFYERDGTLALLAHIAFGLILFELGYRINLGWLRHNPWLGVTSLAEALGTFAAVFAVARGFHVPLVPALMLSALAMSTSPASVLRVANELHSAGQVTERMLHLTAFNCVLAIVTFKFVVGYWVLQNAGALQAAWASLVVLIASAGLGILFGIAVPALLRLLGGVERHATIAFAIAVIVLAAVTQTSRFSPILATLVFGLVARRRRVVLSQAQRNFGSLGDLLTVLLFVFAAATLDWRDALAGWKLGLAVVAVRLLVKTAATYLFAHASGISWRKGILTGVSLAPIAVFTILLLEQTRQLDTGLVEDMAAMAAIVLALEVLGPVVTQRALMWAGEARPSTER
jgi:Kef-type K+ transport system membrane component KefB